MVEEAARELLTQIQTPMANPLLQGYPTPDSLNDRELEVLRLIANGSSNRQIAEELIFSIGTVKWYAHQIYSKLGVGSRTQAIARARELNLLA
jgi:LuxR family transcriptional regulator, maltose regulon positive regulatory protein